MQKNENFLLKKECYDIVGVAMKVHSSLGFGFLEAVYQEALEIGFTQAGIPFSSQHELKIRLWGRELKKTYCADFFVFNAIIVEIKAQKTLTSADEAQLLNYMKAADVPVGLLLNFGAPSLEFKRFVCGKNSRE